MQEFSLFSALLIGIAGSVHCAGMCGPIVSSFTFILPKNTTHYWYMVAYNVGRILSYGIAGAIVGTLGAVVSSNQYINPQALVLLSAILLILMGLYLGQWSQLLSHIERLGKLIWTPIRPLSKKLLPFKHPLYALPYGMIWGWLPCGLVYSTLSWAAVSGTWYQGMLTMIIFGLGTLPVMLAIGASASSLRQWLTKPWVKHLIAASLIVYGLILFYQGVHNW